jgi:small-conductance mechanosensitive channel
MSELLKFEFSEFSFLGIIILAVLLTLILKMVNRSILKKKTDHQIRNYYPLFEVIIWFSFLLWGINFLLQDSIYHMVAILSLAAIIVAGLGWFVIRDIFAGIVLRFSDKFYPGQNLRIDQLNGRIKEVGMLRIAVQQEDGIIVKIPWSKINGQIYSKGIGDDITNRQRFSVEVAQKYPLEIVHPKIREAILLSVGAALNKEPQIKLIESDNQGWQLEITAYALSPEYFHIIKSNVKNVLNSM